MSTTFGVIATGIFESTLLLTFGVTTTGNFDIKYFSTYGVTATQKKTSIYEK